MNAPVMTPSKPDIYGFYDYRVYLKLLFDYYKASSSVFSHRYIVSKAGFKSPTALKNVMNGKRNLTSAAAEQFAKAFKLTANEKRYFMALVPFTQAQSLTEREKYLKELTELQWVKNPSRLPEDQFEVFSKWWHLAIKEIVALPDFRNSSKWVANCISPSITREEASDSLTLLKSLGLIAKKAEGWESVDKVLATDSRVQSVLVAQFHREMIRLGGESITRFPAAEREISGTTLRMGKREVETLKILLREFRMKVLNLAAHSHEPDQVYQLNFQLFPLARPNRPQRLNESTP